MPANRTFPFEARKLARSHVIASLAEELGNPDGYSAWGVMRRLETMPQRETSSTHTRKHNVYTLPVPWQPRGGLLRWAGWLVEGDGEDWAGGIWRSSTHETHYPFEYLYSAGASG